MSAAIVLAFYATSTDDSIFSNESPGLLQNREIRLFSMRLNSAHFPLLFGFHPV